MNIHLKHALYCTLAVLMVALCGFSDAFKDTPGSPGANCGALMSITIAEGSGNGKTSKSDIGCKVKAGSIGLVDPASEGSALSDVITFTPNPTDATKSIATVFSDGEATLPKFTCAVATTPCLTETTETTGEILTYIVTNSTTKSKITYSITTSESEVPEPGALWLLGSGLLALAGIIRMRLL